MADNATLTDTSTFKDWLDAIQILRDATNPLANPLPEYPKDYATTADENPYGVFKSYSDEKGLKAKSAALDSRFKSWLEDHSFWDGTQSPSIPSPQHTIAKNAVNFTYTIMGNPFRSAFAAWVLEN
ncbi:MAG: hypothetical protein ACOYOK_10455, partial [Pseudobdellovibrionaceae bacterium]